MNNNMNDEMVREILGENARRKARIERGFDPLTGRGSTGSRFRLGLPDYRMPELWLPASMDELPMTRGLREAGTARGYVSGRSGRPATEADMMAFDDEFCRLRMAHDFPFWAASHAYIKRKGGGADTLFVLNRPQRRLVEKFEEMRLAGRPIRLLLLKARQWGGSTCVQLYMAWLQLVHQTGLNSLIIAHQGMESEEIMDMYRRLVESYPLKLLHEAGEEYSEKERKIEGVGRSRTVFRVPQRNCKIKVGTAERPDSCRGGDYNLVHCSEVGIWKKTLGRSPEDIVRSACSGVLLQPMTMIVYESTANGTGNFFHREYEAARRGLSQFEPLFVPWYEIDAYSAALDDEEAFAAALVAGKDSEATASDREQPGTYLWWLWEKGATLEAIRWYMSERSKYSDHGMMASEYPSDDVEAFAHSGCRVFDRYRVEELRDGCRPAGLRGVIDTAYAPEPGRMVDDDTRIRMLEQVEFRPISSGGWRIWRLPGRENQEYIENRYVAVVDVGGRSSGADWSVIVVFDRTPMLSGRGPEVVAQWRGHTDFDLLAWEAAMGAKFYDEALLVIESNTLETRDRERLLDGDQSGFLLNRLRAVYPNLYARAQSAEDVRRGAPRKYGFHTNTATKPLVISGLVKAIREGLYMERDEECLNEYLEYERRENGSYGAIAGRHDDLLMTRAIGLHICLHELAAPTRRMRAMPRGRRTGGGMGAF